MNTGNIKKAKCILCSKFRRRRGIYFENKYENCHRLNIGDENSTNLLNEMMYYITCVFFNAFS